LDSTREKNILMVKKKRRSVKVEPLGEGEVNGKGYKEELESVRSFGGGNGGRERQR